MSISSHASWPTSPIVSCPVARSNENRHGLRSPTDTISGDGAAGSSRISLPSSEPRSCAWPNWLPPPPPSPVPSHSFPSGPNCSWPPLWLLASRVRDREQQPPGAGSPTSGFSRAPVLADLDLPTRGGQVDVEAPAGRIVGRERHREQPALVGVGDDHVREVDERRRLHAVADDLDAPGLLHHEHARGVTRAPRSRRSGALKSPNLTSCGAACAAARRDQCSATRPSEGSSGKPRASHASRPPVMLYASNPARRNALVAIAERPPTRQ